MKKPHRYHCRTIFCYRSRFHKLIAIDYLLAQGIAFNASLDDAKHQYISISASTVNRANLLFSLKPTLCFSNL